MEKLNIVIQRQRDLALKYLVGSYEDLMEEMNKHSVHTPHPRAPKTAQKYHDKCRSLFDRIIARFGQNSEASSKAHGCYAAKDLVGLEMLVIEYIPVTRDWMNAHKALVEKRSALEGTWNMTEDQEAELEEVRELVRRNENEHPINAIITLITLMLGRENHLRRTIKSMNWNEKINPVASIMANELRALVGLEQKPIEA